MKDKKATVSVLSSIVLIIALICFLNIDSTTAPFATLLMILGVWLMGIATGWVIADGDLKGDSDPFREDTGPK